MARVSYYLKHTEASNFKRHSDAIFIAYAGTIRVQLGSGFALKV